jgi:alpha-beta hydrolase superfamily lysophospholipase
MITSRRVRLAGAVLALGLSLLNLLAYAHARAMTRFTEGGTRTPRPEALTWGDKVRVLFTGATIPKPRDAATPAALGLAWETRRFPGAFGLSLEAWHVPHPAPKGVVVLVHGYADSKGALLPEGQAFHALGYSALLVDCYGSGGSEGHETSIGWHEAKDVAAAVRDARGLPGGGRVVLFGASMGAAAALKAIAEDGLSPDALIVEAPFDRLLTTVEHRVSALGLPPFPLTRILLFWGGRQQSFDPFRHNPVEYATGVHLPVLFLHGERDERVWVSEARAVFDRLPGEKELVLIPNVRHGSLLKQAPQAWSHAVREFLARRRER